MSNTGIQLSVNSNDTLFSGVHAVAKRSYLTVKGDTMMTKDNRGNGVLCYSPGNSAAEVPMGLFLGLKRVGIHDNGRCGIRVESALQHGLGGGAFDRTSGAVVGGTQTIASSNRSLTNSSSTPLIGDLPLQGQGYLNRCVISGGGDGTYGLYYKVRGNSGVDPDDDPAEFSAIALRAVNTYVWGFANGGVFAELERNTLNESGPTLLTPLVHCTVVDNPAFSVDIREFQNPVCRYFWSDPTGEYLNTMFVHSIFDTRSGNPDLGPNMDPASGQRWAWDNGQGTHLTNLDMPHIASVRAVSQYVPMGSEPYSTVDIVTYEGAPSGINPNQWFLDFPNALPELTTVADWLNAGGDLSEDGADIEGKLRFPFSTHMRNKGGEEDQHP